MNEQNALLHKMEVCVISHRPALSCRELNADGFESLLVTAENTQDAIFILASTNANADDEDGNGNGKRR